MRQKPTEIIPNPIIWSQFEAKIMHDSRSGGFAIRPHTAYTNINTKKASAMHIERKYINYQQYKRGRIANPPEQGVEILWYTLMKWFVKLHDCFDLSI